MKPTFMILFLLCPRVARTPLCVVDCGGNSVVETAATTTLAEAIALVLARAPSGERLCSSIRMARRSFVV